MKKISAQTQLDQTKIREFPIIKEFGISEVKRNLADELLKNVNVESRIGYGGETIMSAEVYIADRKEIKLLIDTINGLKDTPKDEIERLKGIVTGLIYK